MFQTRDVYGLTMYTEATDKLHTGDSGDDKPILAIQGCLQSSHVYGGHWLCMEDNGDDRLADTSTPGIFQTRDVYGLTMCIEATDKLHTGDNSDDKPTLGMFTE